MGASFITPGEIIENSSNLTPGKGTIEHEGNMTMVQGNVIIDSKSNTVSVTNDDDVPTPKVGDYPIGVVDKLGESVTYN